MPRSLSTSLAATSAVLLAFLLTACGSKSAPPPVAAPVASAPAATPGGAANARTADQNSVVQQMNGLAAQKQRAEGANRPPP